MKRKHTIFFCICFAVVSLTFPVLYVLSPYTAQIYRSSFDRRFAKDGPLIPNASVDLGFNSFYLAGATSRKIYLGNYTAPFHLEIFERSLNDSLHVRIKLKGIDSIVSARRFRITVDSPYFFLQHGIMPVLLRGTLQSWEASPFMPDSGYYFVDGVPISGSSFALRSFSEYYGGFQLARKTAIDTPYFKFNPSLLERQGEGIFSVEGRLLFSKSLQQVVYLYTYRNQYVVADTNLNFCYRGNTIDTFSTAQVKVVNVKPEGRSILASPPFVINGKSAIDDSLLFVQSNLLSRNGSAQRFRNSSVIDVYNIARGTYLYSFYIPDYRGVRLSDFLVRGRSVIALFGPYLVTLKVEKHRSLNEDLYR